jgi:hypothetical protein
MAPVETGPDANQTRVTMQDGSTLCLVPALSGTAPGFIEVRREREGGREGERERGREAVMPGLAGAAAGFMEVCLRIRRVLWLVAGLRGGLGGFIGVNLVCRCHAATPVTAHLYAAEGTWPPPRL